jgi:hypothetical protein
MPVNLDQGARLRPCFANLCRRRQARKRSRSALRHPQSFFLPRSNACASASQKLPHAHRHSYRGMSPLLNLSQASNKSNSLPFRSEWTVRRFFRVAKRCRVAAISAASSKVNLGRFTCCSGFSARSFLAARCQPVTILFLSMLLYLRVRILGLPDGVRYILARVFPVGVLPHPMNQLPQLAELSTR